MHIGHANHSYSDPLLESVDIRQIYDKFPEKKGGLKELFGKGPQNAFFLVKFWVSKTLPLLQSFCLNGRVLHPRAELQWLGFPLTDLHGRQGITH